MNGLRLLWAALSVCVLFLVLGRAVLAVAPDWADFALGWVSGAIGTALLGSLAVLWIIGVPPETKSEGQ